MKRGRASAAVLCVLAIFVGVTATSALAAAPKGGNSANVKDAKAFVKKWMQDPTGIEIKEALSALPPSGKKLNLVACVVPICQRATDGVLAGAEELGWEVNQINFDFTPEEFSRAWNSALEGEPDAIVSEGIARSFVEEQMAEAEDRGIPIANLASPDPVGNGVLGNSPPVSNFTLSGKILANWVVADSGGDANVVFVTDPTSTPYTKMGKTFEKTLKKLCPDCSSETLKVSLQDIGTTIPSEIVSYLQANPDVNYVFSASNDATIGLPEALEAAELSDSVKVITRGGDPRNQQNIVDGTEAVTVAEESTEQGWRMIDVLARHFVGDDLACCAEATGVHQLLAKSNIKDPEELFAAPNYEKDFVSLWRANE